MKDEKLKGFDINFEFRLYGHWVSDLLYLPALIKLKQSVFRSFYLVKANFMLMPKSCVTVG